MRYELTHHEWAAIKPMLPNKPRDVPRVNDRRVLNGIFWVLRSGAPWRDSPAIFQQRVKFVRYLVHFNVVHGFVSRGDLTRAREPSRERPISSPPPAPRRARAVSGRA